MNSASVDISGEYTKKIIEQNNFQTKMKIKELTARREKMRIATNKKREEQLKAINKDLRKRIRKALKHIEKNEWPLTEMGFDVKKHKAILLGVDKE